MWLGWTVAICVCLFVYAQFSAHRRSRVDENRVTNNEKSQQSSNPMFELNDENL